MTEEQFLFAAFIHDLGKLLERSKSLELSEDIAATNTYGHAKYSAQLVRSVQSGSEGAKGEYDLSSTYLGRVCSEEVEKAVLFHHRPQTVEEKIIQLADWLQSSEREEKEEKEHYLDVPLVFPFIWVDRDIEPLFYSIAPLELKSNSSKNDCNSFLPTQKEKAKKGSQEYQKLAVQFLAKLRLVRDFEQLVNVCEIYLSQVPAQTVGYESDISLFDHSRLTAALAHCLYRDYQKGLLREKDLDDGKEWLRRDIDDSWSPAVLNKELFWFVKLDLSGIQRFIFNVTSKQAARMLKGRSVYLDLLVRYVVKHLLKKAGVSSVNIVYLGGGNAELLLPLVEESLLEEVRCRVSEILWELHHGEIYLAMEWLPLTLEGLFNFIEKREELHERLDIRKIKRFVELGEEKLYQQLFVPQGEGLGEGESCSVCHRRRKEIVSEEERRCEVCQSFVDLTDQVREAKYLLEREVEPSDALPRTVFDIFRSLGFDVKFARNFSHDTRVYILEDVSLNIEGEKERLADGFLLGSFRIPVGDFRKLAGKEDETENHSSDEAEKVGDTRLGYLKMDVDNLGRIFAELVQKEKERSERRRTTALSRYRALSRRIELFFGGYVVNLLTDNKNKSNDASSRTLFYPVFSGGDDLFVIGRWDNIVNLAEEIRNKFAEYTNHSKRITLSGGIALFPYNFPVIRASHMVEEGLEQAKNLSYPEDWEDPSWIYKDKVGILGEVLSWKEHQLMKELYEELAAGVKEGKVSRAIFKKIERSLSGLTPIIEESLQGKIHPPRIWRFLYYLRDYPRIAQKIEQMVLNNLFKEVKIRNPRLVLVAGRLAALATRKVQDKQKV
jgi:CRISPR-associated protein Csm1